MMITHFPWLLTIRLYYKNLSLLICPFSYYCPTIRPPRFVPHPGWRPSVICTTTTRPPLVAANPNVPPFTPKNCPTTRSSVSRRTHLLKQKGGYFFKGHWLALSLILWALAGVAAPTIGDCWRPFTQSHATRRLGAIGGRRSRLPFGASFQVWLSLPLAFFP